MNLRNFFGVVAKDEMRRARIHLAPKRLAVSFRRCSVGIETAAIHEHARTLAIDRKARINAGMNHPHAVFGQIEPERKRRDELPMVLLERADDFSLQ